MDDQKGRRRGDFIQPVRRRLDKAAFGGVLRLEGAERPVGDEPAAPAIRMLIGNRRLRSFFAVSWSVHRCQLVDS